MATVPGVPQIQLRPWPSQTAIDFYWSPPVSDGGSLITKYTLSCAPIPYSQDISATETYFQVTGLMAQATYTFQITATNAIGEGLPATFRTVQTGGAPSIPSTGTLNASLFQGSNIALLSWTPSTAIGQAVLRGYRLRGEPVGAPAVSSFSWNVYPYVTSSFRTGLSTNISYRFSIEGVNDIGYGFPRIYASTLAIITAQVSRSSLTMYMDAGSNTSYPGSGTTWSNIAPTYSTINYTLVGNTYSTIVYNGTSNASIIFNSNYITPTANMNGMRNAGGSNETREFWFYWSGTAGNVTSEEQAQTPPSGWHIATAYVRNAKFDFNVWNGSGFNTYSVSTGITSNRWYHIVYQWSQTSNRVLGYVDGVLRLNSAATRAWNTNYFVLFGAGGAGGSPGGQFSGAIPVVRYYNRVLGSNEVYDNYIAERARFGL